jgi:putative membrane protein
MPGRGSAWGPWYTSARMTTRIPLQLDVLKETSPKRAAFLILGASALVLGVLLVVIYGHGRAVSEPAWLSSLPALNAVLNATSATFLVMAYRAIRRRDIAAHARLVLVALGASALFLVSYITYHAAHGDTKFAGQGIVRPVYFFVLISHITLSAVALPLVFLSLFFSLSGRFARHRALSRYTFPVWLYVSVTGVVVFAMLRLYA